MPEDHGATNAPAFVALNEVAVLPLNGAQM